ncbi:MAG: UpxY family transcription antiterminator [Planctomycetota bacterium]
MISGNAVEIGRHDFRLGGGCGWRHAEDRSAAPVAQEAAWYAVHTRPRHEKQVGERLKAKGFEVFLPLIRRSRLCRRRRVEVDAPLFSCYLFVNAPADRLLDAGWTPGVIRILGAGNGRYAAVPSEQIRGIQMALYAGLRLDPHPFLKERRPVRVKSGPLAGAEGVLLRRERHHRLVIAIDLIAKAASLSIRADDVEPI